ncbi:DUF2291 family protein [Olivibacter sp. CPCC 100613]|uniref:DUF2291 family protein n=1 Tax=Olivibacter sp. CPCC 100613 TaxID=3079931 RepID=UPI002FF79E66
MMKRGLKYVFIVLMGALLIYHSIYFKSLRAVKASSEGLDMDSYAKNYLFKLIPQYEADFIDINFLRTAIDENASKAFANYAHAASDGDFRYFMVRGTGLITQKDSDYVWSQDSQQQRYKLATNYIYGTAARDAAGLIVVDSFDNTMVFNELSEKINELIRKEVVPASAKLATGDSVQFTGALGLSMKAPKLSEATIIPLHLERLQHKKE